VSDQYIGIYKELLTLESSGSLQPWLAKSLKSRLHTDVEPIAISERMPPVSRTDGRIRGDTGCTRRPHCYESYNDWLVDQREERKKMGLWEPTNSPKPFPVGDLNEELFMGQRAWRKWKEHLCVKRRYIGKAAL
jgi:hypothetical protein